MSNVLYILTKFLIVFSKLFSHFLTFKYSLICCACLELANQILKESDEIFFLKKEKTKNTEFIINEWTFKCEFYSKYSKEN